MTSNIYDSTRLRVVADTPLGNAINAAFPEGFEVTDSNAGCYLVSRRDTDRRWRAPMEHASTPKPVRNSWRNYKSVWVPAEWCQEVNDDPNIANAVINQIIKQQTEERNAIQN